MTSPAIRFLLLLSLFHTGAPSSSIDLTSAIVKPSTWKIVPQRVGPIGAQKGAILDLTNKPPSAHRSMGVPGGFAGGLSDGTLQGVLANPFDLPVKLSIASLRKETTSD